MIMTLELFNQGKSSRGGWNTTQVGLFGEDMKIGGWMRRIIGNDYSEDIINKFLELKDAHLNVGSKQNKEVNKTRAAKKNNLVFTHETRQIPYKDQYLHPNWQKMRLRVLQRDKFTCVECGDRTKTLHAHHLKYLFGKYVWQVPHYYIVTLCEDCHSKEHGRDLTAKKQPYQ